MGIIEILKILFNFAFEPKIAFFTFLIFLIITLIILDEEGAFIDNFFYIGPSKDEKNQTKFIGMKLDTWTKVIIVYIIAFVTSVLTSYYQNVTYQFIHMYVRNPAIKTINYSRKWTYIINILEPILYLLLNIITFFITLTTQFQYIFIRFLGEFLITTPFQFLILGKKKFIKP
jgi:hypothetical protein